MSVPRRIREQRSSWARTPDNNLRTNAPDGYLADFAPVPWDAGEEAAGAPGGWWVGSDNPVYDGGMDPRMGPDGEYGPIGPAGPGWGPRTKTTGSPLTIPEREPHHTGPGFFLPAVTRCVSIITEAVVRTRWLYRDAKGEVIPRPLFMDDPMLQGGAPGPIFPLAPFGNRVTGHGFYTTLLADAILWGQGGFVFIESADGSPLPGSLMMLNPFMFGTDKTGHVVLDKYGENPLRTDYDGRFEMGGQTWRVAVLHGQNPLHDGWPEGVLLKHWPTFRIGARLQTYTSDFYRTGIPSGYLSVSTPNFGVDVPDPDRPGHTIGEQDLLKRKWMKAHGKGKRSVAVLNSTVTYTPIAANPVDADAVKMADSNLRDVAHAFGLSSIWLDIGVGGLSYSNASERRADFVSMTAAGWGEKMTNLVSNLMPYGTTCEIIWPQFIAPSSETMLPALTQAVQAGMMTAGEARQMLSLTPWTGPDPEFKDTSKAAMGESGGKALSTPEAIQKLYLGVGKMLTIDEARTIANEYGAGLEPGREIPQTPTAGGFQ